MHPAQVADFAIAGRLEELVLHAGSSRFVNHVRVLVQMTLAHTNGLAVGA